MDSDIPTASPEATSSSALLPGTVARHETFQTRRVRAPSSYRPRHRVRVGMADASDQRARVKGKTADQISRTDFHAVESGRLREEQTRKIWRLLSRSPDEPNQIRRDHSVDRRTTGADPLR